MVLEWVAPTLAAVKHREDLKEFIIGGLSRLLGRKTVIVVTGMPGAGKSVLVDHLTGKAFKPDYKYPLQSRQVERGKAKAEGKRVVFEVIPGQDARPRHEAIDKLFGKKATVDGVIHVVSNGFASVRSPDAQSVLTKELKINSIPKFKKYQMEQELEDLEHTLAGIRNAQRHTRRPKWLIVALDKIDLYHGKLNDAIAHYCTNKGSGFVQHVEEFRCQVGSDNIHIAASAVFSRPEQFQWGGQTVEPELDDRARDQYLAGFLRLIASYCN